MKWFGPPYTVFVGARSGVVRHRELSPERNVGIAGTRFALLTFMVVPHRPIDG